MPGRSYGLVPGRESALTWAGELLKRSRQDAGAEGKFDAMTGYSFSAQPAQQGVGILGVAQVADAVLCVQARDGEMGGMAMEPAG